MCSGAVDEASRGVLGQPVVGRLPPTSALYRHLANMGVAVAVASGWATMVILPDATRLSVDVRQTAPTPIVIERTFADALGVSVGDRLSVNGTSFTVAGIAVTAAQAPYPNLCNGTLIANTAAASKFSDACPVPSFKIPMLSLDGGMRMVSRADDVGLIWTTEANAIALTSKANPLTTYAFNLKLTNPSAAQAFAFDRASAASVPLFSTWEGLEAEDAVLVQDGHGVLEPGAVMLALLPIASVAVLVGRRLSEYGHRVGLLKAVGGSPSVVAATFLAENLVLALFAAGTGSSPVGWRRRSSPSRARH